MRIALAAAVAAVCLVMPAHAASYSEIDETVTSTPAEARSLAPAAAIDEGFRLQARASATSLRDAIKGMPHIRFAHHMLQYFPMGDSRLHLSLGMQKEKRASGNNFYVNGVKMFSAGPAGDKRRVSPGFAIGYDEPLSGKDTVGFDLGMRMARDPNGTQLRRLVSGNEQHRLGARSSQFGPVAHLTFIHSF